MFGFFVKQLLLVPLDTSRNIFDFNTIIEELFDFKGDTPVYSPLASFKCPVYSSSASPKFDSPVYSLWEVETPQCIQHSIESIPQCITGELQIWLSSVFTTGESEVPVYSLPEGQDFLVYSSFITGELRLLGVFTAGESFYSFELF